MSASKLIVDCDECSFRETTTSYSRAQDIYDDHHIVSGHRPPITERSVGRKTFRVVCDRHGVVARTDYYERGKDLADSYHIRRGCRPVVEEV